MLNFKSAWLKVISSLLILGLVISRKNKIFIFVSSYRARSIYERGLDMNHRCVTIWLKYAEMEMKLRQINHARNIWDRAVTILPRVNQFWWNFYFQFGNILFLEPEGCLLIVFVNCTWKLKSNWLNKGKNRGKFIIYFSPTAQLSMVIDSIVS